MMTSECNVMLAKIKREGPIATFSHFYAHYLNLMLSAKPVPENNLFFIKKTVEGLEAFSSKSAKRTCCLPRAAPTPWNTNF